MKVVKGQYSEAIIFTDDVEDIAMEQIKNLCDQSFVEGAKIRIMPDTHAGKSCVIGFTADLKDKVIPNIVGVDIGCGMLTIFLGKEDFHLEKLDEVIKKYVPSGKNVHEGRMIRYEKLQELYCYRSLKNSKRLERSIGTLGGGNHFIEVDKDKDNNKYLVIHSGSRNLGTQVAEYYQNLAVDLCSGKEDYYIRRDEIIDTFKKAGKKVKGRI